MRSRTGRPASTPRRRLLPENPLPDADEERAAGAAAHALRRRHAYSDRPQRRPRGRARRPSHPEGPRRDRGVSSRAFAPTNCAARRRCCAGSGHSFSDVPRKVVSIINLASVAGDRGRRRRAGRSAALSRQPYVYGLAGVARVRPARTGDCHRAVARGCASSSASCAARRPTSTRRPARAT